MVKMDCNTLCFGKVSKIITKKYYSDGSIKSDVHCRHRRGVVGYAPRG